MKTAKMHIAVIELTCPECEEHISNDDGSHMFLIESLPEIVVCDCCNAQLKMPSKAKNLKVAV